MTGFEFDQGIWEAAIKSVVPTIAKKVIDDIQSVWGTWLDRTGNLTDTARVKLEPIAKQYATNFYKRHGTLKVLSMPEPIPLDRIYVAVQVLNPDYLRFFESIDGLEGLFRQNRDRNFQKKDSEKLPGLTVARDKPYLMVLGAPGSGKSTFLRKVGIEAIKGKQGSYQQPYIPVLLELKTFRNQEINLLDAIAAEFKTCGLPRYEALTTELLERGKLLILLDGLDEIPSEQMSTMVIKIQDFVDIYDKNRFIISCRIAAYRHNFRRFSDVAVANFDDEQIEIFINNWFSNTPELAQDCWEKLSSWDYAATKELAQTPVLLTLICVLYQRLGQFPTNRATIYERALRVLLEEWNAAQEIPQAQIYKGLDSKRKELMLSEIAYSGFVEDRLFFQKRDLSKQIEKILPEMLPDEKLIDGYSVLRDIEVQHGILVERAESIYSFSHLTIQEFLTALHIYDDATIVEQSVNDHLFNQRWREVFLLLAGLKNNGDDLLLAMENRIQQLVQENPKLQVILEWIQEVVDPADGDIKSIEKRVITIVYAYINALIKTNAYITINENATANASNIANAFANAIADSNTIAHAYANAYANAYTSATAIISSQTNSMSNIIANTNSIADFKTEIIANAVANANSIAIGYDIANNIANEISPSISDDIATAITTAIANQSISYFKEFIEFCQNERVFKKTSFSDLITLLNDIKKEIPDNSSNNLTRIAFQDRLLQVYREAFDLPTEVINLSKDELEFINNTYLYANKLLIDCRANAVRVRCWQDIESRMLLPVRPKP